MTQNGDSKLPQLSLYDTTLRDGTQGEDVSFSVEDKLRIAQRLDEFGIDFIEGGWPGSNPRDQDFFRKARKLRLSHAHLTAFGSTRRSKNRVETDPNILALLESETPVVTIFGKTWILHVTEALRISEDENLDIIEDSVSHIRQSRRVIYDAEHFFDGYKSNAGYALRTLESAERGGAEVIVLCDTNGGTMTHEISAIVSEVRRRVRVPIGIHTHNDAELAVANTIAAVQNGATHIQGTINGYGERCGNANLCSVIPNLQLKLGYRCLHDSQMAGLTELSLYVSELANLPPKKHLAYVGQSAFAHKGGVHVSAVMKNPQTYEHIPPFMVGNRRRVLVSDLSGRSNVLYKAQELGIGLEERSDAVRAIVTDIKEREFEGYSYEEADGSFELLVRQRMNENTAFFELEGFKVIINAASSQTGPVSEALIKVRVGNEVEHTAAEGNGPVNALDRALRKALGKFYPKLRNLELSDYKVRVLDGQEGTKAKVRVLITMCDGTSSWNTIGVSTNIIEASWKALVDGISYHLAASVRDTIPKPDPKEIASPIQ